ncbi:hypothetical protein V6N11_029348 [Hibiscus sabdariffa]|uniref:Uncharacterized protein n=1 Tax=Hibiscus sabdariffa TaxID=183260 RepID=A0ABR2P700_9ROSI
MGKELERKDKNCLARERTAALSSFFFLEFARVEMGRRYSETSEWILESSEVCRSERMEVSVGVDIDIKNGEMGESVQQKMPA